MHKLITSNEGATGMHKEQRQIEILNLIQQKKCTTVSSLSAAVFASEATIRRDLHTLEKQGLIRLLYGSIVPLNKTSSELPLSFRVNQSRETKRRIAQFAAGMIQSNSSVLLDSSSSALYMADYINPEHNITVFTNCIKTALKLHERGVTVYLIGGRVASDSLITNSSWTIETIRELYADYLFFSAQSLGNDGCISGISDNGTQIRKEMIERTRQQYFLCSAEKVGTSSTFTLCHAGAITGVICNTDLSFIPDIHHIHVDIKQD